MKVLVTGATGFVGSHLCDLLARSGHEVFALVRSPEKAQTFSVPGNYIRGDLAKFDWLEQLPDDLDAVIHTAGIVHSFFKHEFLNINAEATKNLIDALKARYQKLHFLLVSSQAAGGPATLDLPATEEARAAVSHYGHSKLQAEAYTLAMANQWSVTIVRPPMVMGPRDPAMLDIFKMVFRGFVLSPITKPENKIYSYVCVFDLVQFFHHVLTHRLEGTFYCAYPKPVSLKDIIAAGDRYRRARSKSSVVVVPALMLKSLAGMSQFFGERKIVRSRLTGDKLNEILPNQWVCDSSKSRCLKFEYEWDLERTVQVTLRDYQSRRWL